MTLINALRLSKLDPVKPGAELLPVGVAGVPVKAGAEFVPPGVSVCEWVPSAEPVKVCAGTVPPEPLKAGTPAGHAFVPAGVKAAVPLVPAGVNDTVPFVGTPAGHAFVPAGVKEAVPLVPAGVKETVPFVGTPAGQATVPAGVPAEIAAVDPLRVAADALRVETVKSFTPVPEVASASVPAPCK